MSDRTVCSKGATVKNKPKVAGSMPPEVPDILSSEAVDIGFVGGIPKKRKGEPMFSG
ncbi:hypothetical protein [Pelagibius sp.]|uniref:hypothetical protein n=1 Tax=Pelagibius sp. TaxID=1931238 RepID=UPI0026263FD6|nr:hypothetical protein [Pelagibius sp.]